jgi:essential nuclear protein 1
MGKDIYFRHTKEKAVSRQDRRADRELARSKRPEKAAKKNISKKDADGLRRLKLHKRTQRTEERREELKQRSALQKLNEGKMGKLSFQEKRAEVLRQLAEDKRAKRAKDADGEDVADEDWEDVDEHEKEVYATTGYFDCPDSEAQISKADEMLLQKMEAKPETDQIQEAGAGTGERTLADIIMQKLATGDFVDGDKLEQASKLSDMKDTPALDQKVVEAYRKVGVVMRSFKSGKLPKAFKIIP